MATPRALEAAITDLAVLADSDLRALWRQVQTADQARDALLDVLPSLITTYGLASAALTADWYDDARDLVETRGRFRAIPADLDDQGAETLARWGVSSLYVPEPRWDAAQALVSGGMQRRIANFSRLTVTGSALADPAARGWVRVGNGGCDWCAQYLDGEVRSVAYDFDAHDFCKCGAQPAWQ